MNEFELIEKYFTPRTKRTGTGVIVGVGDDCSLLKTSSDKRLAVSVDTLVSEVHFPVDASAENIAQRALRVCLSDLAAIGADARWFTLALTLPEINETWLSAFSLALNEAAKEFDCVLVGGDTTKGPLTISIQVIGEVREQDALLRSTASPGDSIYVTGSLGDAAAALALINGKLKVESEITEYLLQRFYRPQPCFHAVKKIQGLASAAIDISDGLLADLAHICKQSHVGAEVDLQQLPYSFELEKCSSEEQREAWALSGGDDYELCFTVSEDKVQLIDEMTMSGTLNATAIGRIVEGSGVQCYKQGSLIKTENSGYLHFE